MKKLLFVFLIITCFVLPSVCTQMPRRVLITGGAGFLGSNLAKKLWDQGHEVFVVDSLLTGAERNIKELIGKTRFTFIEQDIIEPIDIKVDWIFNLASAASPKKYQFDPVHTTKTNVIGTLNMLELAKKYNARILQASTSEVYGDPLMHPQSEYYWGNVNPIGPRSCYDESKRCAESLCFDFYRMYDVDIKVVRIFNTYGPGMSPDDGRVVSNFIVKALENRPLTIYGDGLQTRSFCYVDDLVDGFIAMMESNIRGPVNLGNPDEYTILQLAQIIKEMIDTRSDIIFCRLPKDDPTRRRPDITLATKYLDWEPKISLKEGLVKTIEYFRSILEEIE